MVDRGYTEHTLLVKHATSEFGNLWSRSLPGNLTPCFFCAILSPKQCIVMTFKKNKNILPTYIRSKYATT